MNKLFGKCILPDVFRQTRQIPFSVLKKQFESIFQFVQTDLEINRIADIGCGCGRLFPGLIAAQKKSNIIGVDISQSMLDAVPIWVSQTGRLNLLNADCRLTNTLENNSLDFVVLHWILNTTECWEDIITNIHKWKKKRGVIAWFEEKSDLYSAIDGHYLRDKYISISGFEHDFWDTWYKALGDIGKASSLSRRNGLSMNSNLPTLMLESLDYKIVRLNESEQNWTQIVNLKWIFQNVFLYRAFSNFWQLPDQLWGQSVKSLLSFVSRYEKDIFSPIVLKFKCTPVVAIPNF